MLSKTLTIENSEGLHMRPAGVVAKEMGKFVCDVTIVFGDKMKKQQWLRLKNLQARTLVNNL